MAQNLANKKTDYASHVGALATLVLQLKPKIDAMVSDYFGEGFNSTGAAPIIQTDLVAPNDYLTPAIISTFVTNLQSLQGVLTATVVQQFEQCTPGQVF
jgi:hypothetical protein